MSAGVLFVIVLITNPNNATNKKNNLEYLGVLDIVENWKGCIFMGRNLSLRIGKRKKNGVPYFSVWVPERLSVDGRSKERLFRKKVDADVYRLELLEAWRRVDEVPLDSGELADARAALLVLKEAGLLGVVSLEEAVRAGLPAVRREAQMTVSALLAEFRRVRSKGWRERTEKNFRYAEGRFCAVFGERTLGSLRAEELSEWLDSIGGSGGSRANLRRTLEPAFNYAVRQEVLKVSPWEKVETERREIVGAVDVLTVPEALRLMEVAPEDCKAAYALLLFSSIHSYNADSGIGMFNSSFFRFSLIS